MRHHSDAFMTNLDFVPHDSPLHLAAAEGNTRAIRILAKTLSAFVNIKNDVGNTPLHCSAANGHVDSSHVLVKELDADLNVRNIKGNAPFHLHPFSAAQGHSAS